MLCEVCKKTNKGSDTNSRVILNPIKITECSIDNDIHKRIYEDEYEEYSMLIGDTGELHNPYGPAIIEKEIDHIVESWYYKGDKIEPALILENKTIKTESGQVGVILKLIEGKIHQALIGDEKFLVAIK